MLYYEIQTVKVFMVLEVTSRGHSRSSTTSYFVRSTGLYIRDRKSRLGLYLFSGKGRVLRSRFLSTKPDDFSATSQRPIFTKFGHDT